MRKEVNTIDELFKQICKDWFDSDVDDEWLEQKSKEAEEAYNKLPDEIELEFEDGTKEVIKK